MITKQERTELRSVVRQQFKVLRAELQQREAELDHEVEQQIDERFKDEDQTWGVAMHKVHEAVLEANRQVNDALYEVGYQEKGGSERAWVVVHRIPREEEKRTDLRRLAATKLRSQVKAAQLRLDREEADLMRTLSVGALESEEAFAFLSAIPTVGELVPAARLAELEASFEDPDA